MHQDQDSSIFMVPLYNPSNSTFDKTRINPNPNPEVSAYTIDIFNCKNCKKRPKFDDKGKLYDVCNVCLKQIEQIKQQKQNIIKKTQFKYKKSNKKSKKKSSKKSK